MNGVETMTLSDSTTQCCGQNLINIPDPEPVTDQAAMIHTVVREHYAAAAQSGQSCCESNLLYPEELLIHVPEEIANFSLGCGNPITAAALQAGETVLDLGSGGGLDCILAARQVGESGQVIGVDMTPAMLERARANIQRLGIQNIEFRAGFLENLPVAAGEVDVVISNCVINLSPDKPQVFREIFRALKPGGRMAVSDIVTNGALPEALQKDMQAWGACVAGALDMQDYMNGLRSAGFVDIRLEAKDGSGKPLDTIPVSQPFSANILAIKPG
jgi:arsenite methyltransferase